LYPILVDMRPFSTAAVKSPATTCTCTSTQEQDELIGEIIKVFLEEDLVDEIQLSKGLDNKSPKRSTVKSPATTRTPTKEQVELIGEIRVFLEEALVDVMGLECKELLVQDFFDEKRTKKPLRGILKRDKTPLRGILKKKKLVLRKGLK